MLHCYQAVLVTLRTYMYGTRKRTRMISETVFLFLLPLAGGTVFCGNKGQCQCAMYDDGLPIVDCAHKGLVSQPLFDNEAVIMESTKILYFQDNFLNDITLNESEWPSLQTINLRENPINCTAPGIIQLLMSEK